MNCGRELQIVGLVATRLGEAGEGRALILVPTFSSHCLGKQTPLGPTQGYVSSSIAI